VIAYVGQTRSRTLIARLAALGLGELVVRGELPAHRPDRESRDRDREGRH
jgi:hypothetical protein